MTAGEHVGAALVIAALLGGGWLYYNHQQAQAAQAAERRAARIEQQQMHPEPPNTQAWQTSEGTFIVIEHTQPMFRGSTVLELHRCYVWRDATTNTSSLACDQDGGLATGDY